MPAQISTLTIGSELLDGRVADTNTIYIAQKLQDYSIEVNKRVSVVDSINDIHRAFDYLFKDSEVVIVSGGLGPTSDDLTREAVSLYFQKPLLFDQHLLDGLKAKYAARKRVFDAVNEKQAYIPQGSSAVPNNVGAAPGFITTSEKKTVICLPGVPRELHSMFDETVLPYLLKKFDLGAEKQYRSFFKIFGLAESVIGARIESLMLSDKISVSYRAKFPEVHLSLKSLAPLDEISAQVRSVIGAEFIYSEDRDANLPRVVHDLLIADKKTIAIAESCTGGLIGKLLTENDGASQFYLGALSPYSNEIKNKLLGVSADTLSKHGAVSHQCAQEMAANVRRMFHSSLGISVSGIAGSSGASSGKPVGTFFIGFSSETGTRSYKFFFLSSRDLIRTYAGFKALEVVRRALKKLPPPPDGEVRD
jgi:nicotinamide-nucleotide amidase